MCELCRQTPCRSGCPEAEYRAVYVCRKCYGGIWPGQEFYQSSQGPVCLECMDEMSVRELIRLMEEKIDMA